MLLRNPIFLRIFRGGGGSGPPFPLPLNPPMPMHLVDLCLLVFVVTFKLHVILSSVKFPSFYRHGGLLKCASLTAS